MNRKERQFIDRVWDHFREHGRHTLPWRKTTNPYRILVSEVMLQQTQVDRVVPKYRQFLKRFPSVTVLAGAPLGEVLRHWQGLGYNRRARMLHEAAKTIAQEPQGHFPREQTALEALPGVGPYTAAAVMTFAFNEPVLLIETNVRTVYLYHFFKDKTDVTDAEILRYIEATVDRDRPREWYWALMDYGAHLKRSNGNENSRSKQYTRQSRFEGSDRQIRGMILRRLSSLSATRRTLHGELAVFDEVRVDAQLQKLRTEGLVVKKGQRYQLPD